MFSFGPKQPSTPAVAFNLGSAAAIRTAQCDPQLKPNTEMRSESMSGRSTR